MKILVWMMEGPACEATLVLGVAASNQSLLLASSRVIGVVVSWFENCISLIVRVELFSSTAKNFHDMEDTSFSPCAWLFLFEKWAKLNAAFSYCERDIMREKVLAMRLKLSLIGEKKGKKSRAIDAFWSPLCASEMTAIFCGACVCGCQVLDAGDHCANLARRRLPWRFVVTLCESSDPRTGNSFDWSTGTAKVISSCDKELLLASRRWCRWRQKKGGKKSRKSNKIELARWRWSCRPLLQTKRRRRRRPLLRRRPRWLLTRITGLPTLPWSLLTFCCRPFGNC